MIKTRHRVRQEALARVSPTLQGSTPDVLKRIFSFVSDQDKERLMKHAVRGKDMDSQVLF